MLNITTITHTALAHPTTITRVHAAMYAIAYTGKRSMYLDTKNGVIVVSRVTPHSGFEFTYSGATGDVDITEQMKKALRNYADKHGILSAPHNLNEAIYEMGSIFDNGLTKAKEQEKACTKAIFSLGHDVGGFSVQYCPPDNKVVDKFEWNKPEYTR